MLSCLAQNVLRRPWEVNQIFGLIQRLCRNTLTEARTVSRVTVAGLPLHYKVLFRFFFLAYVFPLYRLVKDPERLLLPVPDVHSKSVTCYLPKVGKECQGLDLFLQPLCKGKAYIASPVFLKAEVTTAFWSQQGESTCLRYEQGTWIHASLQRIQ